MFSRDGSLLPSSYADARYIDDVIVSKAYRYSAVANIGGSARVHSQSGGATCAGPLRHFVVWNEVASAGWMASDESWWRVW